jgi:murein DD-endopeptidase
MQIRKSLMGLTCVAALSWCGNLDVRARAQQIGHTSVEVRVLQPPTPTVALGRTHLVYELHLTNFGSSAATLEQIDVLDGGGGVLASWSGTQLWQRVRIVGRQPDVMAATSDEIPPGQRAIAYLWLTLAPGASPAALAHRVTCARVASREALTTAALPLPAPAPPIAPPVRGGPWVAVRAPSNASGHRLSFVAMEGRARVPQRFAVDWVLLGDDGLPFHGDRTNVTNWYGYDAPVYAAAAGTVVLIRDGRPDLAAFGPSPAVMDAAAAPGNVVVIEIGPGRFATYAHLKAGSLSVTQGDRVVAGQPIARIGNSGNTLGPHLHFHVSDAAEPLGGEGLPFALRSFELTGRIASMPQLLAGTAWTATAAQPARTVTGEMPLENMVIRFGNE